MGNPVLDRNSIVDYTRVFYNWGLVDSQGAMAARPLQQKYEQAINRGDNKAAHEVSTVFVFFFPSNPGTLRNDTQKSERTSRYARSS